MGAEVRHKCPKKFTIPENDSPELEKSVTPKGVFLEGR